jgi:hypothetical protein
MSSHDEKINNAPVIGASFIEQTGGLSPPEKATFAPKAMEMDDKTLEKTPRGSLSSAATNPFDTDIEAVAITQSHSSDNCLRKSIQLTRKSDNQVWPGKDHWKAKAKAAKMKRSCTFMGRMTPRNRLITKIVIVLLVVGVAVGVGFGVSKPLHAKIWGDHHS